MAQWESGQLQLNDTSIHYTRTGGDKPPLLLAHGYTDYGLYWTRVAQALEADYDVVMPDARGHGHSPGPDEPYTSDLHADDLAGVIAALNLGQPVAIGHSMGAVNVSLLASRHPDSVSVAVLEDPPWYLTPRTSGEAWRQRWLDWKQDIIERQKQPREALIAQSEQQNSKWHRADHEAWADSKLQFDVRAFDLFQIMPRRWQEVLQDIRCPAMLMTGDPAQGGLVTPELAQEAAALKPDLQVIQIDDAGHSIHRDQCDAFVAAVRTYLNAL